MTDKPLLAALTGTPLDPPPIWLMRQAGRYLPEYRHVRAGCDGFLDLCYSPAKAAEVALQPLRRYDLDAAILFSDILVVADALGCPVEFREGIGPVLGALRDRAAIEALDPEMAPRKLAPMIDTTARLRSGLPADKTLIGFAGAPWTVATYMVEGRGSRDFVAVKTMAYGDPGLFSALIDRLVAVTADYLIGQIEAGADAVQLFDSWAGALPPDAFQRWVIEPTKAVVARVRTRCPETPIIGFAKGAGALVERYANETGVSAVSLDTTVPLDWAVCHLPSSVALQGNLDPVLLVTGGAALDRAIDGICRQMAGRPFVFNLGHGILPQTPPDNVQRLVERVKERGRVLG